MKVFKYRFSKERSAKEFLERVNKETGGCATHPFSGKKVKLDTKSVLVKGIGSIIFDIKLRDTCDKLCDELGGVRLPSM